MASTAVPRLGVYLAAIRFEHTVFALPFAYMAILLAAGGWPGWGPALLVTGAMAGARTGAMAANRLIDARIDARNPRTADRALVTGQMRRTEMVILALSGFAVLVVCAAFLHPLALALSPLAIVVVTIYPYAKRFTYFSHAFLGLADSIAAAGAWIAIAGGLDGRGGLLALAMAFWIAGFDIIYACQDIAVDRAQGLHSVPARFGIATALWVSRLCHLATVLALVGLGLSADLSWPFWIGVAVVGGLLVYESALVRPNDLSRLQKAFFDLNGYISLALLAAVIAAVAVG